MSEALLGAIAIASFAIGLFFLRYWLSTRDRFFLYFTASFWLEGANRTAMVVLRSWSEDAPIHYLLRLVAYTLILVAIWEKNHRR
jgi:hypothetical protein